MKKNLNFFFVCGNSRKNLKLVCCIYQLYNTSCISQELSITEWMSNISLQPFFIFSNLVLEHLKWPRPQASSLTPNPVFPNAFPSTLTHAQDSLYQNHPWKFSDLEDSIHSRS
jgi:hypothetical protein